MNDENESEKYDKLAFISSHHSALLLSNEMMSDSLTINKSEGSLQLQD